MRRALVGIVSTFLGLVLACEAFAEKRIALVIGNGAYAQGPLSNPPNDAELIAESLREVGFEVVAHLNSDQNTMKRAILDFGRRLEEAGKDAVGLFYYAGHGVQARGANFLIPVDSAIVREADLEVEAVEARWVLTQMRFAGNRLNMVILDACRNNPYRVSFRSATRGLARMDAPSGSLVAYSAGPGNVAFDGGGRNSPYTAALAAAMKDPDLDLEDVFKAVRRKVEAETNGAQTPWEESSLKGDFYFVPKGSTVTVTPPGAPPPFDARALELAFWRSIEASGNPAVFEEYLKRYPSGLYVGLAKIRLEELSKAEETAVAALPPAAEALPAPEAVERGLELSREDRRLIQRGLSALGYDAGLADGIFGRATRGSIRGYQVASKDAATGYLTAEQAKALMAQGRAAPEAEPQVAVGAYPEALVYKPVEAFRDCPGCPEMVVVPSGSFMMGSPETEDERHKNEGRQHQVRIAAPFAVGRFEVTRDQFDAFVRATGHSVGSSCRTYENGKWEERSGRSYRDPGFSQPGDHPVVCVNWDDAKAYADWLRRETGKPYRLLSEAEWEYVARAGSASRFSFGDQDSEFCRHGNGADKTAKQTYSDWTIVDCDDGYTYTASVGSFAANKFKVHDIHGNVWEWAEDCWNDSYSGAPDDGAAWRSGDCSRRVLRGGSWGSEPRDFRSANRDRNTSVNRSNNIGFRIARTLTP